MDQVLNSHLAKCTNLLLIQVISQTGIINVREREKDLIYPTCQSFAIIVKDSFCDVWLKGCGGSFPSSSFILILPHILNFILIQVPYFILNPWGNLCKLAVHCIFLIEFCIFIQNVVILSSNPRRTTEFYPMIPGKILFYPLSGKSMYTHDSLGQWKLPY